MKKSWLLHLFIALSIGLLVIGTADAASMVPITACIDCHGTDPQTNVSPVESSTRNSPSRAIIGSHSPHVTTRSMACSNCHVVPAALDHRNGKIDMQATISLGTYSLGASVTQDNQLNTTGLGVCNNTSCHGTASPTWGTASCQNCHGYPPVTTVSDPDNKHVPGATPVNHIGVGATVNTKATFVSQHGGCQICHGTQDNGSGAHDPYACYTVSTQHFTGNINMNGPTGTGTGYNSANRGCDAACHLNDSQHRMTTSALPITFFNCGTDCMGGCHSIVQNSPIAAALDATVTQRRAIALEFAQASNHKRSATPTGTVTSNDCGVCHMEGNANDGSINATYHKDGRINLRDPDTGLNIKGVTWSGTGAGSYASTANDAAPVRFSRNLGALESTTDNQNAVAIMINQCLHCHDAGGATNASARVPSGVAGKPFNTTVAANPGGNVLDVSSQFATTNRAYHPILGKQNNSYAANTRMAVPWNGTKTTGNSTSWGYLMTCWDCHATPADTGTITQTVTAHGSAITAATGSANVVELRGVVWRTGAVSATNNVTLCVKCHALYDTSTTTNHSTGSAFSSSGSSSMSMFLRYACTYCHSSNPNPATAVRPTRSADVHGYNTTYAGAAFSPVTAGYGFIRNVATGGNGAGLQLTPVNIGGIAYTPACFGSAVGSNLSNGTTSCGVTNMGTNQTFTVGGTY